MFRICQKEEQKGQKKKNNKTFACSRQAVH